MFGFLKNHRQVTEATHESLVGCLGKLPIYDEFIRHNVSGRCAFELDEWIQQGFSHHTRSIQTRNNKENLHGYTYNFVFTGSEEYSSTVIGSMMGSRDKSGRQYPFLLFKMLSYKNAESLSSTLPCAYEHFFRSALNLCSTDWSLQPINMLKKRVDALYPGVGQASRQGLMESEISAFRSVKRAVFWREAVKGYEKEEASVYIEALRDVLTTVARKSPLRTTWGIEIPLPVNDRTHIHVAFWVRLAETMLGSRGWRPNYIWGDIKNHEQQFLYLFFRPITPIFFSHLLGRRVDNGVLINLDLERKNQTQVSNTAQKMTDLTVDDDMVSVTNEWASWSK